MNSSFGELRSTADADAIGGGPPGAGISTLREPHSEARLAAISSVRRARHAVQGAASRSRRAFKPRTNSFDAAFGYGSSGGGGGSDSPATRRFAPTFTPRCSRFSVRAPREAAQLGFGARRRAGGAGPSDSDAAVNSDVDRALNAAAEQNELEASTSALIRRDAGPLVELIARDVVDASEGADERLRAVATSAVEALVAATVVASREPSRPLRQETVPGTPAGASFGTGIATPGGPAVVGSAFRAGAVSGNSAAFGVKSAFTETSVGTPTGGAHQTPDPVVGALGQALARSGIVRACLRASSARRFPT